MFVELVMRLKVRFYLEMSHQETTRARIFCQNQIGRLEGLDCSQGHVFDITHRGWHQY
jgi:hypothetical protein